MTPFGFISLFYLFLHPFWHFSVCPYALVYVHLSLLPEWVKLGYTYISVRRSAELPAAAAPAAPRRLFHFHKLSSGYLFISFGHLLHAEIQKLSGSHPCASFAAFRWANRGS